MAILLHAPPIHSPSRPNNVDPFSSPPAKVLSPDASADALSQRASATRPSLPRKGRGTRSYACSPWYGRPFPSISAVLTGLSVSAGRPFSLVDGLSLMNRLGRSPPAALAAVLHLMSALHTSALTPPSPVDLFSLVKFFSLSSHTMEDIKGLASPQIRALFYRPSQPRQSSLILTFTLR